MRLRNLKEIFVADVIEGKTSLVEARNLVAYAYVTEDRPLWQNKIIDL